MGHVVEAGLPVTAHYYSVPWQGRASTLAFWRLRRGTQSDTLHTIGIRHKTGKKKKVT